MSGGQSELADPPKDGISSMIFAPEHNLLLVSSWNTEVRMYDVLMNAKRASYTHKVMRRPSVSRIPHVLYAVPACGLRWCVRKRQDLKAGGAVGRPRCWTAAGEWTRIGASRGGRQGGQDVRFCNVDRYGVSPRVACSVARASSGPSHHQKRAFTPNSRSTAASPDSKSRIPRAKQVLVMRRWWASTIKR